ncbi:MAG: ChbG/HpnK family deacetylase [Candidatus Omnitrophica bacterium]|nr:ChbG/HpnK family deacetylase [Candidatus Omnitrophota bacterium]
MNPAFRKLIVNADDGNLTAGVIKGVLLAHDRGIVTSTTIFANVALTRELKEAFSGRPGLGLGVHLNITLGNPVAPLSDVRPILAGEKFGKHDETFFKRIDRKALYLEYKAQIEKFEDWLGKPPTHVDTHHHLHRFPPVFEVLLEIAEEYGIPFRLSECVDLAVRDNVEERGIALADHLFPDIDPFPHFTRARLKEVLSTLPEGVNELMTHPAVIDNELRKISSFVEPRAEELEALGDSTLRTLLSDSHIELTHYGILNTPVS